LKKTSQLAGADVENRPYSSPPVIPPDSATHKRFKNKIQPNKASAEKGEDLDSRSRVKGWEINREQFVAKMAAGKDTCKDSMIEMTELVPLLRPKMTHSSTFDSSDSMKGFENMGYRKSSDGSLIACAWDDSLSMPSKHAERSSSLDALKELAHETNFSHPITLPNDRSDKRHSLQLEKFGNDSERICDNYELEKRQNTFQNHGQLVALDETTNVLSKLNMEQSGKSGKDYRFSNIYHGNLIDLNTAIQNPDPQKTLIDLLISSKNNDSCQVVRFNHRTTNSLVEDNRSSTDTSSSTTPTRDTSACCSTCSSDSRHCNTCTVKLTNCHFSPGSSFKSNLPGVVKSGSLDSMKQLRLFRMHATHLGSSDESSCHDEVFLEDFQSMDSATDDDDDSVSENVQLIQKSVNRITQQKPGQNGHDADVYSEKAPLITQGQRSRTDLKGCIPVSKMTSGDDVAKKREQVRRQMTAPPLGFKVNYSTTSVKARRNTYRSDQSLTWGLHASYLKITPVGENEVFQSNRNDFPKISFTLNGILRDMGHYFAIRNLQTKTATCRCER
jgi:hypothetical protein